MPSIIIFELSTNFSKTFLVFPNKLHPLEANKIIVSQASRGAEFKSKNIFKKIKAYSNILVPLFISAFKKADFLAESMESRCYDINSKRTRFKNPSLTRSDVLFASLMILMSIGVIVCDLIINF